MNAVIGHPPREQVVRHARARLQTSIRTYKQSPNLTAQAEAERLEQHFKPAKAG
jgi:hypothetical protein